MTTKNTGGPAFPVPLNPGESYQEHGPCDGMTLRDYFAAKAMQAIISTRHIGYTINAENAYQMADAMIKAREGR